MKKLASILLLTIMFLAQVGTYTFYVIHQLIIREQQRELILQSIPESNLLAFKDSQGLQWEEDGKEFYFKGHMYDVVKVGRNAHGEKIYYAVDDDRESSLIKEFAHSFKERQDHKKASHTIKLTQELNPWVMIDLGLPQRLLTSFVHSMNESYHPQYEVNILVPPPQA